jgi:hypothetical protein
MNIPALFREFFAWQTESPIADAYCRSIGRGSFATFAPLELLAQSFFP